MEGRGKEFYLIKSSSNFFLCRTGLVNLKAYSKRTLTCKKIVAVKLRFQLYIQYTDSERRKSIFHRPVRLKLTKKMAFVDSLSSCLPFRHIDALNVTERGEGYSRTIH